MVAKILASFGEVGDVAHFFWRRILINEIRAIVKSEPDWQLNLWRKPLKIQR